MQPQSIEEQAAAYIRQLGDGDGPATPYELCSQLAACTGELLDRNEQQLLLQAMQGAAEVYHQSTCSKLRSAIENVLVYTLGTQLMLSCQRRHLMEHLPPAFRQLIAHQMIASNI